MAKLDGPTRKAAWADFMRTLSAERSQTGTLLKDDLGAAIDATDDWIDANAASYNAALPIAARSVLSAAQKARLFSHVALKRFGVI